MKKLYYSLVFICLAFGSTKTAYAGHMVGSDISYKCTSTPGVFEVTLVLYRDCQGIQMCGGGCGSACTRTMQLMGADPSCSNTTFGSFTLSLINVRDYDKKATCPTSKNICTNTDCIAAGTFNPSIERYEFVGTVNIGTTSGIPSWCCNVRFVFEECCRSAAISTGPASQNFYVDAVVNRCLSVSPCNSSPVFTNEPYDIVCPYQNVIYNNGTIEPDRDSLSFEFTPALQGFNTSVTYNAPFAYDKPMPWTGASNGFFPAGIYCDPQSGDIKFKPGNASGSDFYGVIAVSVKQWKNIGGIPTVVGITRRDIQMVVGTNCAPNNIPEVKTTPPLSLALPNSPKLSWEVCEGSQLCFDVLANDTDSISSVKMDTTYLSWDSAIASLGATFTPNYVTGAKPRKDSYKFCWTPSIGTASSIPYLFTIKATDSKCPIPGRVIRGFNIKVKGILTADINKTTVGCGKWRVNYTNTTATIPISSVFWKIAKAPFDYTFAGGADTFSNITTTSFKQYAKPGKYLIQLTINNGNCSNIQYDTLYVDTIVQAIAMNDTSVCNGCAITLNASAQYGQLPYTYRWFNSISDTASTPLNIPFYTTTTYTSTPATDRYYTIQVRDIDGCRAYDSVFVELSSGVKSTTVIASQLGLEIFPNPSTGIINITLQTLPTNRTLKLFDIQGKLILEQELQRSQQLNIETQPKGVYMLKIGEWHGQVVKE